MANRLFKSQETLVVVNSSVELTSTRYEAPANESRIAFLAAVESYARHLPQNHLELFATYYSLGNESTSTMTNRRIIDFPKHVVESMPIEGLEDLSPELKALFWGFREGSNCAQYEDPDCLTIDHLPSTQDALNVLATYYPEIKGWSWQTVNSAGMINEITCRGNLPLLLGETKELIKGIPLFRRRYYTTGIRF